MSLGDAWEQQAASWVAWARTPGHDHYFWRYGWPTFASVLPAPGRLTLEVGCGEGRVARMLAERGHRVVGVEPSATLVKAAATAEPAVLTTRADGAALPFPTGEADLVVAYMVLQDVDRLYAVVAELARVLAPSGRLCVALVHPLVDVDGGLPYLGEHRRSEAVEREGLSMVFHFVQRPLGAYFGALERAGLVVEALREPPPPADLVADRPEVARHLEVPHALHLRARHA